MLASAAGQPFSYTNMGLDPVALDLGFFQLRWYSLAYLVGILGGWWYCLKMLDRPGAPMARRHADDMVFYGTLGVILGGRIGYVLFYKPEFYFANPLEIVQLWDGGMSFHGGAAGTSLAMFYLAWKNKLSVLRVHDYVSCVVPIGLFLGRLANFVNGELWGRPTDVSWAVVFPGGGPVPRHPSQLYEAGLEGLLLFAILGFLFWRTDARYKPGLLTGVFVLGYGLSRFFVEFFRQPDQGLENLSWGLTMGQTLTLPMILAGLYLIATAAGRRRRVEPIAGTESVA
ncbi:MAG TPA: prolipoprotein diacylglyceryl transferase [Allosphingosinicella sp.]|jgi:phosphatidylglycerol:prolipoprotein diacylglycerol transferase